MPKKQISELTIEALQQQTSKLSPTLDEDLSKARLQQMQKDALEATRRYSNLVDRAAFEQEIVANFASRLEECIASGRLNIQIGPPERRRPKKYPETGVLVLSDTHIWKLVKRSTTQNFGHYNPKVFLDRLFFVQQSVAHLVREHCAQRIKKLHIMFLGDLVDGALQHSEEIPERGYVSDQVLLASYVFYQFIARLSRIVDIECHALPGNHGRWQNQKKQPTSGRFSNLDTIVMGQVQQLVMQAGPKNVKFELNDQPFQIVDIENWRFKLGHGDHLKGGDKALGVPAHSIGREINATTQRFSARGERVPDFYIVGDKHRHMSVQTATGRYMINGAFFEADNFALHENFTPGRPFQMFFGVHPTVGKTWSYDLFLDMAKPVPIQYSLPRHLLDKVKEYES